MPRLTSHDEVIAAYDRILRLTATLEITLKRDQLEELGEMLKQEASRNPEEAAYRALLLFEQMTRMFWEEAL